MRIKFNGFDTFHLEINLSVLWFLPWLRLIVNNHNLNSLTVSDQCVLYVWFTGYYCLAAQDPIPCRNGTYNNVTGRSSESDCVDCPVGKYCEGLGNSVPDGQWIRVLVSCRLQYLVHFWMIDLEVFSAFISIYEFDFNKLTNLYIIKGYI